MLAFSIGKRRCLGETLARSEMLLVFVTCLQRFEFTAVDGQPMPGNRGVYGGTISPEPYEMTVKLL